MDIPLLALPFLYSMDLSSIGPHGHPEHQFQQLPLSLGIYPNRFIWVELSQIIIGQFLNILLFIRKVRTLLY